MSEVQRDNPLFDKHLSIQIIDGIHDIRHSSLVFRILQGTQPVTSAGGGSQTEKLFHFEITDERDPYFYYYMDVGEQDFHNLKRDQSILVEFNVFPKKLIELIELCLQNPSQLIATGETSSRSNNNAINYNGIPNQDNFSSSFIAKLDTSGGVGIFSVVEANMFKQLTHISLMLKPGDDTAIKSYLASRLYLTLDIERKQSKEIDFLKGQLHSETKQKDEFIAELSDLKTNRIAEIQSMQSSHSQEISQIHIQSMETIEQMRLKYESQLDSNKSITSTIQNDLQSKLNNYEQQISEFQHEISTLEFKLRDVNRAFQLTETDRDRLLKECDEANSGRRRVEDEKSLLQRDVVRLESKTESLIQQLKDREESMGKTVALQRASEDAKSNVEQQLNMFMSSNQSLQDSLNESAVEINNLRQFIDKLQSEVKLLKDKLKLKSEVIRRQEALVTELRLKLGETENQLLTSKEVNNSANIQIMSLKKNLEDAQVRLQESNKLIASNQEVITYLNEEINKWQLGMRINAEPTYNNNINNKNNVFTVTPSPTTNYSGHNYKNITTDNLMESYPHHLNNDKNNSEMSPTGINNSKDDSRFVTHKKNSNLTSSNFNKYDEDNIYLRGINNLGLKEELEGTGGMDLLKTLKTPSTSGLDNFDYYSINNPKKINSNEKTQQKKYDWQADDFGYDRQ